MKKIFNSWKLFVENTDNQTEKVRLDIIKTLIIYITEGPEKANVSNQDIDLIKGMIMKKQQGFAEPRAEKLYRGLSLNSKETLDKVLQSIYPGKIPEEKTSFKDEVFGATWTVYEQEGTYNHVNDSVSSWSDEFENAMAFSLGYPGEYSIIFEAEANKNKNLLLDLAPFYSFVRERTGKTNFDSETETLGLGDLKLSRVFFMNREQIKQ